MHTEFAAHVASNAVNRAILSRWSLLDLPSSWLVAGCLFQTVWNIRSGLKPEWGIKDYDIFYFDPSDLSETAEAEAQTLTESALGDLGVTIEVANQARVHLWYPTHFGYPYPALTSAEEGIGRFLVLETCVGIRPQRFHAPYGLSGLYAGTLTPNQPPRVRNNSPRKSRATKRAGTGSRSNQPNAAQPAVAAVDNGV
jgi:hypothetical protein